MAIKSADQITIVDVTDAYSVMLTSESFTFVGGTSGVASGATCTTQAVAFCGSNQLSSVTVDANAITCPTGISATVSNSGTSAVTITFTTTATVSSAREATIPVVVDGITVNKKFSFAVAIKGTTGTSTYTHIRYSSSADGTNFVATPTAATNYIGVAVTTSSTAPTAKTGYTWSKYAGADGSNGADAISLTITSSAGTVFKNSSGSTVLTAHVYVGGVEKSITDAGVVADSLGSIKWYKGSSTTATATAKTLTISASDVSSTETYKAQLEK